MKVEMEMSQLQRDVLRRSLEDLDSVQVDLCRGRWGAENFMHFNLADKITAMENAVAAFDNSEDEPDEEGFKSIEFSTDEDDEDEQEAA